MDLCSWGPLFRQSMLLIYMAVIWRYPSTDHDMFLFQIKVEADLMPSHINLKFKSPLTSFWDFLSIHFKLCMWVNILLKRYRCWIEQSQGNRLTKSNKLAKPWILLIAFFLLIFISDSEAQKNLLSQQRSESSLWNRI